MGRGIPLADAIDALREELTAATERAKDQDMQFTLEPIELTVQVVVTKEGDAKIGWSVLGVGGRVESEATQTLTLKLTPLWRQEDGSMTSNVVLR